MSHPNIVGMYDVGQDGDTRYIVMEYVRGVTLERPDPAKRHDQAGSAPFG